MNTLPPATPPMTPGRPWPLPIPPVPPVAPVSPIAPAQQAQTVSDNGAPNGAPDVSQEIAPSIQAGNAPNEPRSKRRDKVLYVRVNLDEKEKIVAVAQNCRLSISRYLTRLALEKRPPPTDEDRKRLETLLFLFKRTEANVRRLHAEASRMRLFSVVPGIEDDFEATLETVRGLIRELGKRL